MPMFHEDPSWHQSFEGRKCNQALRMYSLAPFFDVAGILLRGAANCWYPWGLNRKKELRGIACELIDYAERVRGRGIGWMQRPIPGTLSLCKHHRFFCGEAEVAEPEMTTYMTSASLRLLLRLVPVVEKITKDDYQEKPVLEWLFKKIEALSETPCIGLHPEISDIAMQALGEFGILLECEGLAYMQARIADSFYQKQSVRHIKKPKKNLSDQELASLALDLDMSFQELKNVLEDEYSSWWEDSGEYRKKAECALKQFYVHLESVPPEIGKVLNAGSLSMHSSPECFAEETVFASERITLALIAMFLSFKDLSAKDRQLDLFSPPPL